MAKNKEYSPGERVSVYLPKNIPPEIIEFLNIQGKGNESQAILKVLAEHIIRNGIRPLIKTPENTLQSLASAEFTNEIPKSVQIKTGQALKHPDSFSPESTVLNQEELLKPPVSTIRIEKEIYELREKDTQIESDLINEPSSPIPAPKIEEVQPIKWAGLDDEDGDDIM